MCSGFETGNLQSRSIHAIIFISNLKRLVNKKGCLLREDLDYRFFFSFLLFFYLPPQKSINQTSQTAPGRGWTASKAEAGAASIAQTRGCSRFFPVNKTKLNKAQTVKDQHRELLSYWGSRLAQISTLKSRLFISPTSDANGFSRP